MSRRPEAERSRAPRSKGPRPGAGERAPATPGPASLAPDAGWPEWVWWGTGAVALLSLLWSCRGAMLGTAVADDYSFLAALIFKRPLDLFDSMGAALYWRPLSRQLYFSAVGGWLIRLPWLDAALHALVLLALFGVLYRVFRRGFVPPVAAAIAAFPLLSEPVRVLLGWASGAQHLLAALGAALAIHEALAGRALTGAVAALAGVLSHESAAFALPILPAVAWYRSRSRREVVRWGAVAAGVAALWGLGYAVALRHGVKLPAGEGHPYPWAQLPSLFSRAVAGALNLEDLGPVAKDGITFGYVLVAIAGLALGLRRAARARIRERAPVLVVAAAWFVAGTLPLALVLPDWNAWRAWIPALALGVAMTGLLGLVSPRLAGAFAVLRLTALLLAPTAPPVVAADVPATTSHISLVRIERLKRAVDSARRALTARYPELPHRAAVRYWYMPRLAEFAFQGPAAVRVWYRDSTLSWSKSGREAGLSQHVDAMLQFDDDQASPASIIESGPLRLYQRAGLALLADRYREADSLYALALQALPSPHGALPAYLLYGRAAASFHLGYYARAESLNRAAIKQDIPDPGFWALAAALAIVRNDREYAIKAVTRCLTLDPNSAEGRQLAQLLQQRP